MFDFLNELYYGNTVAEWAIAFGIILLSVILARIIYSMISRYIKRVAKKTESELDDLLVDMVEEPIVGIVVVAGIRYAFGRLTLAPGFESFVTSAINFALTVIIAWLIIRLYEAAHKEYLVHFVSKTDSDLDDQILPILRSGIRFIVIALAIVIGLNNAGYDVGAIVAGLGIGGLAFALAAQDTVANLFGGITIFIQRPFKVGEYIILDDQWLQVQEIGLRVTTLKDFTYEHIVFIPNSKFTSNKITNISRYPSHQKYLNLKLSPRNCATKIEQALGIIRGLGEEHPELNIVALRINDITPEAVVLRFAIVADEFKHRYRVIDDFQLSLLRAFEENEIRLALPTTVMLDRSPTHGAFG